MAIGDRHAVPVSGRQCHNATFSGRHSFSCVFQKIKDDLNHRVAVDEHGGQRRIIPVRHSRTISPDDLGAVLLVDSVDPVILQAGEVGVEGDTVDIVQTSTGTVTVDGPQDVFAEGLTLRGQWCAATLLRLNHGWVLFGAVV